MFPLRICPLAAMPLGSRYLRLGCRGRDVLTLQRELMAVGLLAEADGRYGYVTETAVRRLQAKCRLPRDGVAGPDTIAGLHAIREGQDLLTHRVRPGETLAEVANILGVTPEALRRQNLLPRRGKLPAGLVVSVRARLLLLETDRKLPPVVKSTAILGPPVCLSESGLSFPKHEGEGSLPLLTADGETWDRLLRRPETGQETITDLRKFSSSGRWVVDLPAHLWWRKRRLLRILAVWKSGGGSVAPIPLIRWPSRTEPLPDLPALSRFGDYLIIDPGPLVFLPRQVARLVREVTRMIPASRLILLFRAGGLLAGPQGGSARQTVREARAATLMARTRLVWDETDRIYTASYRGRGREQAWDLRLLEERGLREYARLVDRLDCAGLALSGLDGVGYPVVKMWPGEFAVLDSFSPPRHID